MFYLCLLGCCSVGLGDLDVFISDFENSDSENDHACKYVGCYYFFSGLLYFSVSGSTTNFRSACYDFNQIFLVLRNIFISIQSKFKLC